MESTGYLKQGVAEIEIIYKNKVKPSQMYKVENSKDVYDVAIVLFDDSKIEYREQLIVMFTNRANKVLSYMVVSICGMSGTVADPKMIFQSCLKVNASGFICAHNHPSGNLKPSDSDITLTRKLKQGGAILDIAMLDHLIVTTEGYYSFADEGLL